MYREWEGIIFSIIFSVFPHVHIEARECMEGVRDLIVFDDVLFHSVIFLIWHDFFDCCSTEWKIDKIDMITTFAPVFIFIGFLSRIWPPGRM